MAGLSAKDTFYIPIYILTPHNISILKCLCLLNAWDAVVYGLFNLLVSNVSSSQNYKRRSVCSICQTVWLLRLKCCKYDDVVLLFCTVLSILIIKIWRAKCRLFTVVSLVSVSQMLSDTSQGEFDDTEIQHLQEKASRLLLKGYDNHIVTLMVNECIPSVQVTRFCLTGNALRVMDQTLSAQRTWDAQTSLLQSAYMSKYEDLLFPLRQEYQVIKLLFNFNPLNAVFPHATCMSLFFSCLLF